MRRLVIIGNSAAGLAAIEAIRSRDRRSRVTLIAAERHLPYSRILLTYLLAGKIRRDELFLHGRDWYEQMGVEATDGPPCRRDRHPPPARGCRALEPSPERQRRASVPIRWCAVRAKTNLQQRKQQAQANPI